MTVYKCDRCGKLQENKLNEVCFIQAYTENISKRLEVCDECYGKVYGFTRLPDDVKEENDNG